MFIQLNTAKDDFSYSFFTTTEHFVVEDNKYLFYEGKIFECPRIETCMDVTGCVNKFIHKIQKAKRTGNLFYLLYNFILYGVQYDSIQIGKYLLEKRNRAFCYPDIRITNTNYTEIYYTGKLYRKIIIDLINGNFECWKALFFFTIVFAKIANKKYIFL